MNGHGETTALPGRVEACRTLLSHHVPLRLTTNFAKEYDRAELDVLARNLRDMSLERIQNGEKMRALRRSLLEGKLDAPCAKCGLRGVTTPSGLADSVRMLMHSLVPPAGFSGAAYLAANPDVAAAGADPVAHFLRSGRFEGRRLRPGG